MNSVIKTSDTAIAIFVKTPHISPLKTRLAKDIGTEKALEFYQLSLACVKETALKTGADVYWAVAEKECVSHTQWQNLPTLWTSKGCLGERQYNIYETLRNDYKTVVLLGSDCPQMTSKYIAEAIDKVNKNMFLLGQATDGGYTLFCGQAKTQKDQWTCVEYSQDDTREALIHSLGMGATLLPALTDVDTLKDLQAAINEMPTAHSNSQENMVKWVSTLRV